MTTSREDILARLRANRHPGPELPGRWASRRQFDDLAARLRQLYACFTATRIRPLPAVGMAGGHARLIGRVFYVGARPHSFVAPAAVHRAFRPALRSGVGRRKRKRVGRRN